MSIFEQATKQKLRFPSAKGELTTEQLWDLPLQSKTGFDLDTVAKAAYQQLKDAGEQSFVAASTSPANERLVLTLDVVKRVIAVRLEELAVNRKRLDQAVERQKLLNILANKQDQQLQELSVEDLQKKLDALQG